MFRFCLVVLFSVGLSICIREAACMEDMGLSMDGVSMPNFQFRSSTKSSEQTNNEDGMNGENNGKDNKMPDTELTASALRRLTLFKFIANRRAAERKLEADQLPPVVMAPSAANESESIELNQANSASVEEEEVEMVDLIDEDANEMEASAITEGLEAQAGEKKTADDVMDSPESSDDLMNNGRNNTGSGKNGEGNGEDNVLMRLEMTEPFLSEMRNVDKDFDTMDLSGKNSVMTSDKDLDLDGGIDLDLDIDFDLDF